MGTAGNSKTIKSLSRDELEKKAFGVAKGLIFRAAEQEVSVTSDLQNYVNQGSGHLTGLDHRLKTQESLSRKLADLVETRGGTLGQYAMRMFDVLRYTNVSPSDTLADDAERIISGLESRGYQIVGLRNTMHIDDAPYKGINAMVQNPKGYVFELQFHTPESLDIKRINHELYEEQRLASTSAARKQELTRIMIENAKKIPKPRNIHKIKDVDDKV